MPINTDNYSKEDAITILREDGFKLLDFPDTLKNDRDVVLAALQYSYVTLAFISDEFKNDKSIVLLAVKMNGAALQDASANLKNDKDIVMQAVTTNGLSLKYVSTELKNDNDIVLRAVEEDGGALQYAGNLVKNNMSIILSALYQTSAARKYIEASLLNTPEIKFMLAHGIYTKKSDWSLVKRALLEKPDYFLNPEPYMKALTAGMEYPYLMLAEYALNKDAIIESTPLPEIAL